MLRSSQPNTVNSPECISGFDFETREKPFPDAPGSSEGLDVAFVFICFRRFDGLFRGAENPIEAAGNGERRAGREAIELGQLLEPATSYTWNRDAEREKDVKGGAIE